MRNKITWTAIIFIFTTFVHAQFETETVLNRKTGEYEQRNNPMNQVQRDYEQRQEDLRQQSDANLKAIDDRYNRSREESREKLRKSQEFWQDRMRRLTAAFAEINSRRNYGNAIIKAGKATTIVKLSRAFSLKNYLLEQANTPALQQLVEQYAESSLKKFRDELRTRGLNENDYADGGALAFIISYEIYFDQKPTTGHLKLTSQKVKASLLKNPIFQSHIDDTNHQQQFEFYGALVEYAKTLKEKGKLGDAYALTEAKNYARLILEQLWGNSVNTIYMTPTGFIHRGLQIIKEGKATHLYKYNPNLQVAKTMVSPDSRFKNDIVRDYQDNLQKFYQVMASKGGQKGDLAWSVTMSAYANYLVITNGQDWNAAQFKSVYDFVKTTILKSPDIQVMNDEPKQIACESLAIRSASNYEFFTKGEGISAAKATATLELDNIFRALNEDPDNYQFTANGIVKVK